MLKHARLSFLKREEHKLHDIKFNIRPHKNFGLKKSSHYKVKSKIAFIFLLEIIFYFIPNILKSIYH